MQISTRRRVQFYGAIPFWLRRLSMPAEIAVRRRTLLSDNPVGIEESDIGVGTTVDLWHWPIRTSPPGRHPRGARRLPQYASFENLNKVLPELVSLRPKQLTVLLSACRSANVYRLFFVFADQHQHGWCKHLDISDVDFGSGPRALASGGRFHPTYRISLPESLMPGEPQGTHVDA